MTESVATADARLSVDNVSVQRGSRPVVRDVSLSVPPGKLVAIVGPNGGGKSTLLNAILGQVPFIGSISMQNVQQLGYVPQQLDFDRQFPMTVEEFLCVGAQSRPVWLGTAADLGDRIAQLGTDLEISDLLHRSLGKLSGGELRRVLLAQALIPEPELLILDEAGAGVDMHAGAVMQAQLQVLRNRGMSILMVSHQFDRVKAMADHVVGLRESVMYEGSAAEVLTEARLFQLFA